MKPNTSTIFSLILWYLSTSNAGSLRPARAMNGIGFSKRQDQWIGGAALHSAGCPTDLTECGANNAQNWCCPKDSTCRYRYCCPNSAECAALVRTFPSCADPSWTLCFYDYYNRASNPEYYCCKPGEQCFRAEDGSPVCGSPNLPVQSTQKLSVVSPSYTRSAASPSNSVGPSVGSQQSQSPSPSTSSTSSSSSILVSDSGSQVIPSITRGVSAPTSGGSPTSATAGLATATTGANSPNATSGTNTSSSGSSGLSTGAIVGIVIGALLVLAVIALVGIFGIRYGSKRAVEVYATAAAANAAASANAANTYPPVYNAPEGPLVTKPEVDSQPVFGVHPQIPPGPHVELGADDYGALGADGYRR